MTVPGEDDAPDIDWSAFDDQPEQTLSCACGMVYRSHAKALYGRPHQGIHARKACPACGRTNQIRRASTDPEHFTIGGSRDVEAPGLSGSEVAPPT